MRQVEWGSCSSRLQNRMGREKRKVEGRRNSVAGVEGRERKGGIDLEMRRKEGRKENDESECDVKRREREGHGKV